MNEWMNIDSNYTHVNNINVTYINIFFGET